MKFSTKWISKFVEPASESGEVKQNFIYNFNMLYKKSLLLKG